MYTPKHDGKSNLRDIVPKDKAFSFEKKKYLPDMDNLRRSIANAVHAQQLKGLGVEDQLEESIGSSEHLALGKLLVVRDAHLALDIVGGRGEHNTTDIGLAK